VPTVPERVARHPLFRLLPSHVKAVLAEGAAEVDLAAGETIVQRGRSADDIYLIERGLVVLEVEAGQHPALEVQTLRAGEVLGVSWLFEPYQWGFSGRVVQDVHAIRLDGAAIRRRCEVDHELRHAVLSIFGQVMYRRLQATRMQLLDVYRHRA
jgi:CRP-like cAMP-binding protein